MLTKTGIPYLDFTFNPCGFGCSKGCPGCWARQMAKRGLSGCPDCKEFKVHFHPERLGDPAKRKKPAVIGVQFTGELFEPARLNQLLVGHWGPVKQVFHTAGLAPQHQYVFLTQRPQYMRDIVAQQYVTIFNDPPAAPGNWFFGCTIKSMNDIGDWWYLWRRIPGHKWLSLEPLHGPITIPYREDCYCKSGVTRFGKPHDNCQGRGFYSIDGAIIGCDNRKEPSFDLDWVYSIVAQCKLAGVPVYVKQIRIDGKLLTDPADFPEDLRIRELPWTLTTKEA